MLGTEYSSRCAASRRALPLANLHSLRVAVDLPCIRCGYDIRGLHADGHCPECGLDLIESIAARVDPDIAYLPELPRPRASAWSLLLFTLALTGATLAAAMSFAAHTVAIAPPGGWRDALAPLLPATLPGSLVSVAPVSVAVAIVAAIVLAGATALTGLHRIALFAGLGGWLVAACLPISSPGLALAGAAAAAVLVGIGPTVIHLGVRSRTYRQRTANRQAIGPLTTALVVGVVAVAGSEIATRTVGHDAATPFRLVAGACLAMAVVGFLYLLLNAYWIWRALRSWLPLLERVVEGGSPPTPPPDPTA